jgi:hypothetical protein
MNLSKFQTGESFENIFEKLIHAKFLPSRLYPDGLRNIFDRFEEIFRIFQEHSLENSEKIQT